MPSRRRIPHHLFVSTSNCHRYLPFYLPMGQFSALWEPPQIAHFFFIPHLPGEPDRSKPHAESVDRHSG
jgi:hypothetical protein